MNDLTRKLTCELIGTFALTFIGAGAIVTTAYTNGSPGLVGIALAHGVILAIVVTATMGISGGHINPAVTLGFLATGRIPAGPAVAYIIAQCVGATIAGTLLSLIFRQLGDAGIDAVVASKLGTPNFAANVPVGVAILVEILLTFLLMFAIYGTAVDDRAPRTAGYSIGLTVAVDILMGGPITGAAMNPARTLGTLLGGTTATNSLWTQHWVYWVGPVVGAVLAAFIYEYLILGKAKK